MKINFLILFVAFFFLSYFDAVAQKGYVDEINQVNNEGQKEGFWKENVNEHFRTETYYHKGKKNGIYKMFNTIRNELVSMGEYKNDIETGIWYIFGDYGHLLMMQSDFQKNTYQIPLDITHKGYVRIVVIVFLSIRMVVKNLKVFYFGMRVLILILFLNTVNGNITMKVENS